MTTYLSTALTLTHEEVTLPFCSPLHRGRGDYTGLLSGWGWAKENRDDDRYEFDENCSSCGVLILASSLPPAPRDGWGWQLTALVDGVSPLLPVPSRGSVDAG
jgi:hypothetical protein